MSAFDIDIAAWIPRDFGDPAERMSLAEIAIRVDGVAITEVEDLEARTTRPGIRVSAAALAHWLAANWHRLRWEAEGAGPSWRMSHAIGAAAGGYLWPDMNIASGGDTIRIRARPIAFGPAPVRFLNGVDANIPARDFEDGVRRFVDAVVRRLGDTVGESTDGLDEAWRELAAEVDDPDMNFTRAIEARMGYDAGEADPRLLDGMRRAASEAGRGALGELAVSSGRRALADFETLWRTVRAHSRLVALDVPPALKRQAEQGMHGSRKPWQRGVSVARSARREWFGGIETAPTAALAELCSVSPEWINGFTDGEDAPIPAGFRDGDAENGLSATLKKRRPVSRRFALARVIGDHLAAGEGENLLPVTDSPTDRQKFQRAFAREFLCPFDSLRDYLGNRSPDDEFIEDAALRFEVSPMIVGYALMDNGMLERDWRAP